MWPRRTPKGGLRELIRPKSVYYSALGLLELCRQALADKQLALASLTGWAQRRGPLPADSCHLWTYPLPPVFSLTGADLEV